MLALRDATDWYQQWAQTQPLGSPTPHGAVPTDKTDQGPETGSANSTIHKLSNYSPV